MACRRDPSCSRKKPRRDVFGKSRSSHAKTSRAARYSSSAFLARARARAREREALILSPLLFVSFLRLISLALLPVHPEARSDALTFRAARVAREKSDSLVPRIEQKGSGGHF